jgi:uncharacterized membrane protein YuzA (DUF378 family)
MKSLHSIAFILLIIGGLNWLLVALLGYGVGQWLDMVSPMLTKLVYILVGVSALYEMFSHKGRCKECMGKGSMGQNM